MAGYGRAAVSLPEPGLGKRMEELDYELIRNSINKLKQGQD